MEKNEIEIFPCKTGLVHISVGSGSVYSSICIYGGAGSQSVLTDPLSAEQDLHTLHRASPKVMRGTTPGLSARSKPHTKLTFHLLFKEARKAAGSHSLPLPWAAHCAPPLRPAWSGACRCVGGP